MGGRGVGTVWDFENPGEKGLFSFWYIPCTCHSGCLRCKTWIFLPFFLIKWKRRLIISVRRRLYPSLLCDCKVGSENCSFNCFCFGELLMFNEYWSLVKSAHSEWVYESVCWVKYWHCISVCLCLNSSDKISFLWCGVWSLLSGN